MGRAIVSGWMRMAAGTSAAAMMIGLGAGCGGTPAHVIDSNGTQVITSVDQIDIQDWNHAAAKLSQSLLDSGVLDKSPHMPAIMAISRIKNDTQQDVNVGSLSDTIRVALNKSGKVLTTTTVGVGDKAEDPLAKTDQEKNQFYSGQSNAPQQLPDYTLSGNLTENDTSAGDVRQSTFTFKLSLTDQNGNAVWEDRTQVTKQGSHNSVGM